MQISLRSQLAAGVVVAGAAALAVAPVVQPEVLAAPQRIMANIQMTAFDNPLGALVQSLGLAGTYLFSNAANTSASWLDAGIGAGLNTAISAFPPFPGQGYATEGLLTNILAFGLPILSTVAANQLDVINSALAYGGAALGHIADIFWAIPNTALLVAQNLAALNIPGAVTAITTGVAGALASVTDIFNDVVGFASDLTATLATRLTNVSTFITGEIGLLPQLVTAQFGVLQASLAAAIADVAAQTTPEGVWNAVVANFLSPNGALTSVPNTILNLTVGAGVANAAFVTVANPAGYIPSVRGIVQSGILGLAGALSVPLPAPTPAATVGPRAALRGAAPAASATKAAAAKKAGARSGAAKRSAR